MKKYITYIDTDHEEGKVSAWDTPGRGRLAVEVIANTAGEIQAIHPYVPVLRYPNKLTFVWQRTDGDYEVLAALNGEMFDDDDAWNNYVDVTYGHWQTELAGEVIVWEREDLLDVLVIDEEEAATQKIVPIDE